MAMGIPMAKCLPFALCWLVSCASSVSPSALRTACAGGKCGLNPPEELVASSSKSSTSCEVPSFLEGYAENDLRDGWGYSRCFSVAYKSTKRKLPVVLCFHATGGSDSECHTLTSTNSTHHPFTLGQLAISDGFALVGLETTQVTTNTDDNAWMIPSMNQSSQTPCDASLSPDSSYVDVVLQRLAAKGDVFDTSKVFVLGISVGAAAAQYHSICLRKQHGSAFVSSFIAHSTGLFTENDGLDHPHVGSGHGASVKVFGAFGKVAAGGTSGNIWPIVPKREPNLKLCLFDSTADILEGTINVYKSSLNLKRRWEAVGNAVEAHFTHGGSHTYISSLYAMLACLDDGKNVLVGNSSKYYQIA